MYASQHFKFKLLYIYSYLNFKLESQKLIEYGVFTFLVFKACVRNFSLMWKPFSLWLYFESLDMCLGEFSLEMGKNDGYSGGHIFLPSLKSCAKLKDLNIGLGVHAEIARTRFLNDAIYVGRSSYWYVCGMRMHYERKTIFICSFVFVDLSASTRSVEQWLICMRSNWVSAVIDMYVECGYITSREKTERANGENILVPWAQ